MPDEVVLTKVEIISGDIIAVPFHGTVAAGARLTLCSKIIGFKYKTKRFRVSFPLNTNRTLQVSFWICPDDSTPTATEPVGDNVFRPYGQATYVVGDDEQKDYDLEMLVNTEGTFLKVHGYNIDSFEHTIDCCIFVERVREGV